MDMDLRTTELGRTFTYAELQTHCRAVWGGVSFPGKRAGFAIIAAVLNEKHFDSHDISLLDEYESFDMRKLIRQCGALNFKYRPSLFFGDWKNDAAGHFIDELNEDNRQKRERDSTIPRRQFELSYTPMLEMENLYSFILPQLKDLLTAERRQLFLKGSKIVGYLSEIEDAQISELAIGSFPAIEALAFSVIELRDEQAVKMQQGPQKSPYNDNILTRGLKNFQRYR